MANVVDTREEAEALDRAPLIVRRPLEEFLDKAGLGSGEIQAEEIGDGHSNITYLVTRGGEKFVLRRPPRPPLPPSAHDVLREARLLEGLGPTEVRTPTVLAICDDESVLGVPFYVMEFEDGVVMSGSVAPALDSPAERRRIAEGLIDGLAEVHSADWRAAGLEWFGKPTGYLDRQLRRFNGLWEHNKTRELPLVQEVGEWLATHKPESPESTIVHGDYRLGNVMFANDAPAKLIAIFDWELATIGDPLADVGYLTATWTERNDGGRKETMFDRLTVTQGEGFPNRDELVGMYEERTGRSMSDLRWYQALALWKAAVFMEGNYKRSIQGNSDDPYLKFFDVGVPQLAEAAHEITQLPAPSLSGTKSGLIVDFGGVLTTNVFDSFNSFCEREGLQEDTIKEIFRDSDGDGLALLRRLERGEIDADQFADRFAPLIGVDDPDGLVERLFRDMGPDDRMLDAVRAARDAGIKTGLISNSWGSGLAYDQELLDQLFDAVIISGDVGLHKPEPEIYELGAAQIGVAPADCVFVDDLRENCAGAEAIGMTAILHRGADGTLPRLEELLGVELA